MHVQISRVFGFRSLSRLDFDFPFAARVISVYFGMFFGVLFDKPYDYVFISRIETRDACTIVHGLNNETNIKEYFSYFFIPYRLECL